MPVTLNGVEYLVRRGESSDLLAYLQVCQKSAHKAYSYPSSISVHDLFSEYHYFHPSIMPYWESLAQNNDTNQWWVAELQTPKKEIVGGIILNKTERYPQGFGYYVHPDWQGLGIGRSLWSARKEIHKSPLLFEVYSIATKTIDNHIKHGARATGRQRMIHWDSWPREASLTALEFMSK